MLQHSSGLFSLWEAFGVGSGHESVLVLNVVGYVIVVSLFCCTELTHDATVA